MLSTYRLPNKVKNEEIIRVLRRDLFVLFKKVLLFLLLTILPFAFFYLMMIFNANILENNTIYPLVILAISAYYLFIWLFFFFSFIDYYLDVWIITSERIIDIQQRGFFSRIISEQKLFRIQDVTSEVNGAIPTIFKYGDVHVQTAGTKQRFFFHEVPNPDKVRDIIIRLVRLNRVRHKEEIKREGTADTVNEPEENPQVEDAMKH